MPNTLWRACLGLVPTSMLLVGAVALFARRRTADSLFQLVGAGGLVLVVLTHVAEGLGLFPGMGWGARNSPGHYLDLGSAFWALPSSPWGTCSGRSGTTPVA